MNPRAPARNGIMTITMLAVIVSGIAIVTTARADTTIDVAVTKDQHYYDTVTNPTRYSFNLVDPPFNETDPINAFGVDVTQTFGNIDTVFYTGNDDNFFERFRETFFETRARQGNIVHFVISNTTHTVDVRIETEIRQTNLQNLYVRQEVYVDGEFRWYHEDFIGFGEAQFSATAMVGWANGGVTAWTDFSDLYGNTETRSEYVEFDEGIIYWTPFTQVGKWWTANHTALGHDGSGQLITNGLDGPEEANLHFLAQMDNVRYVDVDTLYAYFGDADDTLIHYLFMTENARTERALENEEEPCRGIANGFERAFGICPTLTGLVTFLAGGTAEVVSGILGALGMGAVGDAAGILAGLWIGGLAYILSLILFDPISFFIVLEGHVIFYALIFSAYTADPTRLGPMIISGSKWGFLLPYLYVVGTAKALMFAFNLLAQLFSALAQVVRG